MKRILTGALVLSLLMAPGGLAYAGDDDKERDEASESASAGETSAARAAGDAAGPADPESGYVPMTFIPIEQMTYRSLDGSGFTLLNQSGGAARLRAERETRPSLLPVLALGGLYHSLRQSGGAAPAVQVPAAQVSAAARGPVSAPEPGALALLALGLPLQHRRRAR